MESPAVVSADVSNSSSEVNLTIQRLDGGEPLLVNLPSSSTLKELKLAVADVVSSGPFNFRLLAEDGTVLTSLPHDSTLSDMRLADGDAITLVIESARDYSKIVGPETVIKSGQYPNGILIDQEGRLYVSHYFGELKVYSSDLKHVLCGTRTQTHPRQMACAPAGELLVAFSSSIHVLDPTTLKRVRQFGSGDLKAATGIAVDGDLAYVSDARECCLHVYRFSDGTLLRTHRPGLKNPQAIAVVDGRLLAVADRGNDRVLLLNIDTLEVHSQLPAESAPARQRLSHPNDVIVDSAGNLLVMDTGNERIAVFEEDGSFVTSMMDGFFKDHGNTFSYMFYNCMTGAIAVSNNDEHCITVFSPIFAEDCPLSAWS
eukprot:TRINITY_DN2915_c0_g1_i1.p1 TRINITY_DN2915_c0_g1~~TRINITY_DN2915_c0_g1_i1.p1  ORF type:complete len:372 (-),score=47.50 TRINITY_DN2915_c0_g1_i1:380-1495(-)